MKIGIIGATGNAGRLIAKEAYDRGHEVTAIVIDPENIDNKEYAVIHKSIYDLTVDDVKDFDAVINCFGVFNPAKLFQHQTTVMTLIYIFEQLPNVRFLMVGGAASLYTDETKTTRLFSTFGMSEDSVPGHMAKAFAMLRESNVNWTYFSPAANFDRQGPRTSQFIIGDNDVVIKNEDGDSYISYADYAIAMLDEVEQKRFIRRRLTAVSRHTPKKAE